MSQSVSHESIEHILLKFEPRHENQGSAAVRAPVISFKFFFIKNHLMFSNFDCLESQVLVQEYFLSFFARVVHCRVLVCNYTRVLCPWMQVLSRVQAWVCRAEDGRWARSFHHRVGSDVASASASLCHSPRTCSSVTGVVRSVLYRVNASSKDTAGPIGPCHLEALHWLGGGVTAPVVGPRSECPDSPMQKQFNVYCSKIYVSVLLYF